jgi:hypothetical protein
MTVARVIREVVGECRRRPRGRAFESPPGLEANRALLERTSTAGRVADIVRARITEGFFPPGPGGPRTASEERQGWARNTLREAFRLLTHERLVGHELTRGMFVRILTKDDVVDLYRVGNPIEVAAVNRPDGSPGALHVAAVAVGGLPPAAQRSRSLIHLRALRTMSINTELERVDRYLNLL